MNHTFAIFQSTKLDLSRIGVERCRQDTPYFCTPVGAEVFACAGVDGIHFCRIQGYGDLIFSVSPMNSAPDYVHPVAACFSDFIRLLLACGDSAALEQAWQWNEQQFDAFLRENTPDGQQHTVLEQLSLETGLSPMEQPWQYIRELQSSFDSQSIPFSAEYYELTGETPICGGNAL